ncbi:putative Ig domain-containing protein [Cellulosimicrobium cellulans]|uniref:RCC1 domain-containing protein n=1 Tax=Cellulosimicrobium cellulans TaxID=1710 RepID=UPI002406E950|nr:putative Ig domain-containing protein [Cellulosimicrobium cellulans]MDF9875958.1 LPXTG-motif cell wall-anchored protein [Cellulosimicrobium cellulans]
MSQKQPPRTSRRGGERRKVGAVLGAGTVALALVVSAAMPAAAVPDPDFGPSEGGTTVTMDSRQVEFVSAIDGAAIGSDGWVYTWGDNTFGQLGDGTTAHSPVPVAVLQGAVPDGVSIVEVAGGSTFTVALGDDGSLYSWGRENLTGAAGDYELALEPYEVPRGEIPAGATITQIVAGPSHALVLTDDGSVYGWGQNNNGQLGDGTLTGAPEPVALAQGEIPAGVSLTSISAGPTFTVALGDDGNAYAWGHNLSGYLGDGTQTRRTSPVAVARGEMPAGVTVELIAASHQHVIAWGSDGQLYAWGSNQGGTAQPPAGNALTPIAAPMGEIPAGSDVVSLAADGGRNVVLTADGAYSWGYNNQGMLGVGSTSAYVYPPAQVVQGDTPDGVEFVSIDTYGFVTTALGSDGTVYTWGQGAQVGTLGSGSETFRDAPGVGPNLVVTSVTFDGIEGTDLQVGASTLTVDTPAHPAGAVDVVVQSTLRGGTTATDTTLPTTYVEGFTYVDRPVIVTTELPSGVVGDDYSVEVEATGSPTLEFAVTAGELPDGLSLDPATGELSGQPTTEGSFTVTVSVTNAVGADSREFTIDVLQAPQIITETLPAGEVGGGYQAVVEAIGSDPISFSVVAGELPPGLVLDAATGALTGEPTASGDYTFTIGAQNDAGTDEREYTIAIDAVAPPSPDTDDGTGKPAPTSEPTVDSSGRLPQTGVSPALLGVLIAGALSVVAGASLLRYRRRTS